MERAVSELRDHFIVCGYGRVGSMVARELVHGGQRVVVVDIRPESLETARADGHLVVAGDGTSDRVLTEAGVQRARGLVTSIDSDANNVYVTLSARAFNPGAVHRRAGKRASRPRRRCSRPARTGSSRPTRWPVGGSPSWPSGRGSSSSSTRRCRTVSWRSRWRRSRSVAGGPLDGRTVGALRAEGIFTLAVVRGPGAYDPNPPDERLLTVGETLIVSGSAEILRRLRERA